MHAWYAGHAGHAAASHIIVSVQHCVSSRARSRIGIAAAAATRVRQHLDLPPTFATNSASVLQTRDGTQGDGHFTVTCTINVMLYRSGCARCPNRRPNCRPLIIRLERGMHRPLRGAHCGWLHGCMCADLSEAACGWCVCVCMRGWSVHNQ